MIPTFPQALISRSSLLFFLTILFTVTTEIVFAQDAQLIEISGKMVESQTNEPLANVSIGVKGTESGTISDIAGNFKLKAKTKVPFVLKITSVGFLPQEIYVKSTGSNLQIAMVTETILGSDIVVTASRVSENIMRSPVAIDKLNIRALKETPAASFYDAIGTMKGVQLTTSSLTFKVPNTRGFNIPNNFRFMQLVDGVDMQAASLGVPLGNAIGPTELDIQSIEVTPGAASALYGMNAINGMANLITKDPFKYPGLSIFQRTGVNHVDGKDHTASLLTETAIRYAANTGKNFAFKINASYMRGTDWISDTRKDQNPDYKVTANPSYPGLDGELNPAFDGWNKYGDDALQLSNTVSVTGLTIDGIANRTLTVARTGYWEKDLVDPQVDNAKFDGSLYFKLPQQSMLSYGYRIGKMDGLFQRGNKIKLDDIIIQNHHLDWKGRNFAVKAYILKENSGNSYNVKPLADNLDLYSGGSASQWNTKFKNALLSYAASNGGALTSSNLAAATAFARQQADASRVVPGTAAFQQLLDMIRGINNWDIRSSLIPDAPVTGGAALVQKSNVYQVDGQWDLTSLVKKLDVLIGADYRVYELIPDGNNFVDLSRPIADRNKSIDGSFGRNIYYRKAGGFIQAGKLVANKHLKLTASIRSDYNPYFKPTFTPRLAAVYTIHQNHNIRLTYQLGFRFPALFEALSYVNNGRVKRVGILPIINEGLGFRESSYSQPSVALFNAAVKAAGNSDSAALANRSLLQPANLPDGKPEGIRSFEIGYKGLLAEEKVFIDLDLYTSMYTGFLGQVQVYVPKGALIGSDAAVIAMIDRNRDATQASGNNQASKGQERYRVYTNARNRYVTYGSSLGVSYVIQKNYLLTGNVSYNKMQELGKPDLFVTGFNTPLWSTNLSFGKRAAGRDFGYNISWKYQDGFTWESPLVTGPVASIHTLDAQWNYNIPSPKTSLKIGGTNILNNRHIQYAGGPTIGALYYVAVTFENISGR